jgi:hypothetical protein
LEALPSVGTVDVEIKEAKQMVCTENDANSVVAVTFTSDSGL